MKFLKKLAFLQLKRFYSIFLSFYFICDFFYWGFSKKFWSNVLQKSVVICLRNIAGKNIFFFFFREVLVGVQPDDFISQQELRRGHVMMGVYGWRASWPIAAGRTRNSEGRGNFGFVTTSLHEKRLYESEVGMKWRAELKFALPGLQLDTRTSL